MAEATRRFLDSDGNRHAIGDLDELREAVDRVKVYQDFQPDKFDQRELDFSGNLSPPKERQALFNAFQGLSSGPLPV